MANQLAGHRSVCSARGWIIAWTVYLTIPLFIWCWVNSRDSVRRTERYGGAADLKLLDVALHAYAQQHDGQLPPDPAVLQEFGNASSLRTVQPKPLFGEEATLAMKYGPGYRGAGRQLSHFLPDEALIIFPHQSGPLRCYTVLAADGTVAWYQALPAEFQLPAALANMPQTSDWQRRAEFQHQQLLLILAARNLLFAGALAFLLTIVLRWIMRMVIRRPLWPVSIVFASLLLWSLAPTVCSVGEKGRRVTCAGNLKQIGLALDSYAEQHDGHLPPTADFSLLHAVDYLVAGQVYGCPSALEPSRSPATSDHAYIGAGVVTGDPHARDTIIALDRACNHPGGWLNLVFADGHVQGIPLYDEVWEATATRNGWHIGKVPDQPTRSSLPPMPE